MGGFDLEISELAKGIYQTLDDKKAEEISVIDISSLSVIADYFVIATVNNTNIIVHIFDREARDFYNLEHIWKDG